MDKIFYPSSIAVIGLRMPRQHGAEHCGQPAGLFLQDFLAIAEVNINPVIVLEKGALAVDADCVGGPKQATDPLNMRA